MRIFLADTVHNSGELAPNTVPYNVARIAAFCQSRHPGHSYHLYKDPHELIAELKTSAPDVLAISNYFWNHRLNHRIIRFAKRRYPDMVVVVGGPNLDRNPSAYAEYAARYPDVDFVVVEEGETAFESIISALTHAPELPLEDLKRRDLPGTFAVLRGAQIHVSPSLPRARSLDDLPSPYLNGMLDPFLERGMHPIVEFVRGCPYKCAFCEQGSGFFTTLAHLSRPRIEAEVEYIRARAKVGQLIVADVNFGIIKRDLDVAKFLKASYVEHGWPSELYLYNAKVPTPHVLDCIETLHPIAALCMSFQSTDLDVLKNIHRENIGYDKYSFITQWAKKKDIPVGTELIYGLPGETRASFMKGYETLLAFRADYLSSYNLRLFAGTELNTAESRTRYETTTRFRPMDINLGEYDLEPPERILELEEIVFTNSTLSADDFFYVRQVAFLVESLWNTGYLRPALAFLANHGAHVTAIFDEILASAPSDPGASAFFSEYARLAREELAENSDDLLARCEDDVYWDSLVHGRGVNMKLNLAFAGRLMFFDNAVDDYLYATVARIGARVLPDASADAFTDVLAHCRASKIDLDQPEPRDRELLYDVQAWIHETYPDDFERFRLAERTTFRYALGDTALPAAMRIKQRMNRRGASLSSIAERMMMELPRADRELRRVTRVAAPGSAVPVTSNLADRMSW
jgi:radical SAM superfamily enzyme YgiQ (UPF0313 family)